MSTNKNTKELLKLMSNLKLGTFIIRNNQLVEIRQNGEVFHTKKLKPQQLHYFALGFLAGWGYQNYDHMIPGTPEGPGEKKKMRRKAWYLT